MAVRLDVCLGFIGRSFAFDCLYGCHGCASLSDLAIRMRVCLNCHLAYDLGVIGCVCASLVVGLVTVVCLPVRLDVPSHPWLLWWRIGWMRKWNRINGMMDKLQLVEGRATASTEDVL